MTVGICCTKFGARGAMVIILDEQLVLKKGYHTIKPAPPTKPIGQKKSIHIHECAKNLAVPFTIMPFLKLHYGKISQMATVENHYIEWLKPDLNTL